MNSETVAAYTGPTQVQTRQGINAETGEWTQIPKFSPLTKNQSPIQSIHKGEISFLEWSLMGIVATLPRPAAEAISE